MSRSTKESFPPISLIRFSTDVTRFSSAALTPSLDIFKRMDSSCSFARARRLNASSADFIAATLFSSRNVCSCLRCRTFSRSSTHHVRIPSTADEILRMSASTDSASCTRRDAASRVFSAAESSSRFARMRRTCSSRRCFVPKRRGFMLASGCSRPRNATTLVSTSSRTRSPPRAASAALSASTASASDSATSMYRATHSVSEGTTKSSVRTKIDCSRWLRKNSMRTAAASSSGTSHVPRSASPATCSNAAISADFKPARGSIWRYRGTALKRRSATAVRAAAKPGTSGSGSGCASNAASSFSIRDTSASACAASSVHARSAPAAFSQADATATRTAAVSIEASSGVSAFAAAASAETSGMTETGASTPIRWSSTARFEAASASTVRDSTTRSAAARAASDAARCSIPFERCSTSNAETSCASCFSRRSNPEGSFDFRS